MSSGRRPWTALATAGHPGQPRRSGGVRCEIVAGAPTLSVVVPLHDEEQSVGPLAGRLRETLDGIGESWEVVLVDDGSDDGTYDACVALHRSDSRFRVLRLSRNFGHQLALTAGLDMASGEA